MNLISMNNITIANDKIFWELTFDRVSTMPTVTFKTSKEETLTLQELQQENNRVKGILTIKENTTITEILITYTSGSDTITLSKKTNIEIDSINETANINNAEPRIIIDDEGTLLIEIPTFLNMVSPTLSKTTINQEFEEYATPTLATMSEITEYADDDATNGTVFIESVEEDDELKPIEPLSVHVIRNNGNKTWIESPSLETTTIITTPEIEWRFDYTPFQQLETENLFSTEGFNNITTTPFEKTLLIDSNILDLEAEFETITNPITRIIVRYYTGA